MIKTLKIFNPIPGKDYNKVHAFNPKGIEDEEDYIELGLLVKDDKGNFIKDAVVVITATDASQNKTFNDTGTYRKIVDHGMKISAPYYPYHYEFTSEGKHKITFTCESVIASVDLQVIKKKPKFKKDK